ncbi:aldose 1-epimerase family protein [Companilactobacillus sp. DQM5]|uniref:aldose 1-epimerase family protein n=1 Tax=Companilactobacillus sp. DQM5 TaxID=3463359 RepID=UPI0040592D68
MDKLITLQNEEIKVTIDPNGAELVSVKDIVTNVEYIWQADPKVWKRHAPVLFPIVGKLKNNHYFYGNNEYEMGQHGFARDMKFDISVKNDNFVSLLLKNNSETLKKYPFNFEFYVNYTLSGRSVLVNYQVINPKDEDLYFSIGAHPGFTLPLANNTKFEDYYFEFSPEEERYKIPLESSNINLKSHFKTSESKYLISHDLFKDDALIFELEGTNTVSIKSDKTSYGVEISSDNAEFVGLWSTYPTKGNFVCIEPWWGIADTNETSGNFEEKYAIKILKNKNDEFNANYSIKFSK